MKLDGFALNRILNEFEKTFKDTSFVHQGVNYYPVIRIQFAYQLSIIPVRGIPEKLGKETIEPYRPDFKRKLYYQLKHQLVLLQNRFIRVKSSPTLVVSFKEHFTASPLWPGKQNTFTAPFQILFDEIGLRTDTVYLDDIKDHKSLAHLFKSFKQLYKLNTASFTGNELFVNSLRAVENFSEANGIKLTGLAGFLLCRAIENKIYHHLYKVFLSAASYNKVLTYCFYNNQVMALNRAARDLGIKTLEYQHSQQAQDHFAYNDWRYNLENASNHFPSIFWLWSVGDKLKSDQIFGHSAINSNSIAGGNPYVALIHERFANQQTGADKILIALEGVGVPAFIEEFIAADEMFTWHIRLHPRYPDDKPELERLKNLYPDKIEVEDANSLTLYELLGKVKFCIVCSSGTALEAQAFGVRPIIWGDNGYRTYRGHIESGAFAHVKNASELKEVLEHGNEGFEPHDKMLIDKDFIKLHINECFGGEKIVK